MKLCVVGTGYVGLVGAAIFADWGNNVVGVDKDSAKIQKIQSGEMPIFEPGLSELVLKNVSSGNLSFVTSLADGMKNADIVFICVGTPQSETGAADLSAVWEVAKEIGKNLTSYKVIVTKSTVPVGTNEKVKAIVAENLATPCEFDVASNPEFLRQGSSVSDMMSPDRTVVGSDSQKALDIMKQLYSHLTTPILACDLRSAEMIKYAANAFLATKISFINEIAQMCEKGGADVSTVAQGMGLDTRIGPAFLNAGIGYGGSCFPKDVAALYRVSSNWAYDFKLLRAVMEVNAHMHKFFVSNVVQYFGHNLSGMTFAVLGLSFKGNTDDIRESVALKVIERLRGMGAKLNVYDPEATTNAKTRLGDENITYCSNEYEILSGAKALFILTDWKQFSDLDLEKTKNTMKTAVIFDGRNMLDKNKVEAAGFTYFAVGKRTNGLDHIEKKSGNYSFALLK